MAIRTDRPAIGSNKSVLCPNIITHPRLVEIVFAVIETKEGQTMTKEEVTEFCKNGGLAKYKWPEKIVFAPVPRNPSGKIEELRLRDVYVKPAREAMEAELRKKG